MNEHLVRLCPKHGLPLVIRHKRGEDILGCPRWRAPWEGCQYTQPQPERVRAEQRDMFEEEGQG